MTTGGMLRAKLPRGSPRRDFMYSSAEPTLVCRVVSPRVLCRTVVSDSDGRKRKRRYQSLGRWEDTAQDLEVWKQQLNGFLDFCSHPCDARPPIHDLQTRCFSFRTVSFRGMFGCRGCHSFRVAAVELTFVVVSVVVVVVDVPDVEVALVVVSVVVNALDLQAAVENAKTSPTWDTSTGQLRSCQDQRANAKGMGRSMRLTMRTRNK